MSKLMDFYLVRHGEAKSEEEDPARPLSEQGREGVRRVARKATAMGVKAAEILHSGKLRAKQTAEILAEHLSLSNGLSQKEGLKPLDDPGIAKEILEKSPEPLMLVGHLPHLSHLVSLLLSGDPEKGMVYFETGAMVCLSRAENVENSWTLKWVISPEAVPHS